MIGAYAPVVLISRVKWQSILSQSLRISQYSQSREELTKKWENLDCLELEIHAHDVRTGNGQSQILLITSPEKVICLLL
jgi:hypothetical protein